jgi:hypothetical protein
MNDEFYEGPKKWVKHQPREISTSPEEPEISSPKTVKTSIPLEIIDTLRDSALLPRKSGAYGRMDEIWIEVTNLKGWLSRPATDYAMTPFYWARVRKMLDAAVANHDPSVFDQFADAWNVKSSTKATGKNRRRSGKIVKMEASTLKLMQDLIPASISTTPGKPTSLRILDIIEDFQRRHKRAPTQKEISESSGKNRDSEESGGLSEGDVSIQISDLGLGDLLSRG